MNPTRKTARVAGALYLLSAAMEGIPLLYVPGRLIAEGNAAATAKNLLACEGVFRVCILSELAGAVVFLFMVRALYRLLCGVHKGQAELMVSLVMISVPITFFNALNEVGALTLLHGDGFLSVFDQSQREALAMLFLGLHAQGVSLANIFWGLWLFPFGVLVIKSGFIPRILGVLLVLNGFALVAVSVAGLCLPAYVDVMSRFAIVPELGELWMMGWLLIKGVKVSRDSGSSPV